MGCFNILLRRSDEMFKSIVDNLVLFVVDENEFIQQHHFFSVGTFPTRRSVKIFVSRSKNAGILSRYTEIEPRGCIFIMEAENLE